MPHVNFFRARTDEPAIDLAATSFLMYAWRMAGAPSGTPESGAALAEAFKP
jgi:hypothetical protein